MRWFLLIRPLHMALFDPDGVQVTALDAPLSGLFTRLGKTTACKYGNALRRFLDAAGARAGEVPALFATRASARRAITLLLSRAGCRLTPHKLPNGGVLVTPPEPLVPTVDAALATLSHLYNWLFERDRLDFVDPIAGDGGVAPPGGHPAAWLPMRHFVLTNRRTSLPREADPHCIAEILAAAEVWPSGIRLATHLGAGIGPRISEVFDVRLRDWASAGFGAELWCGNKGSRGRRTKRLYLSAERHQMVLDYVDGDRYRLTGIALDDLRRLWRLDPGHAVFDQPLCLNTRGRKIQYSLFNDYYFRPAMKALGIARTPHWMRHEQTYEGLLHIEHTARDAAEREALIEDLAGLQGWARGGEMAHYYAPQIRAARQRDLAHRLTAASDAPSLDAPQPCPTRAKSPALAAILSAGAS